MKTKTFRKKLMLNKKTVVNLTGNAMNEVYGGILDTNPIGQCDTLASFCGPFFTRCASDCYICTKDTCESCPCDIETPQTFDQVTCFMC